MSDALLDDRSEALIERWVLTGRYASAAEAVRDGLKLIEALEKSEIFRLDELRAAVQVGLNSGPSAPLDMEAVKAEGRRRLDALRYASYRDR